MLYRRAPKTATELETSYWHFKVADFIAKGLPRSPDRCIAHYKSLKGIELRFYAALHGELGLL